MQHKGGAAAQLKKGGQLMQRKRGLQSEGGHGGDRIPEKNENPPLIAVTC
jgi:hypothetical protein